MKFAHLAASLLAAIASTVGAAPMAAAESTKEIAVSAPSVGAQPLSATVESLAARATVTAAATAYGGFALSSSATVYILVRGPSLTSLGVTPNALDAPWVRLYNSSNADVINSGGRPGFTSCLGSAATDAPVVQYYQSVRHAPTHSRDSCVAATLAAGAYTFSVTPSIAGTTSPAGVSSSPSSGEILFEVTMGPASSDPPNRAASLRLVGGTWTYVYTIINTFSDRYRFTQVDTTPDSSGVYFADGVDDFGNVVVGGYDPRAGVWAVLDPGIIIDQFYKFTFTSNNSVSGCYYQIQPPGTTNLSRCYNMNGSRSGSVTALQREAASRELERAAEVAQQARAEPADPMAVELYEMLRRRVK
jgi:hypothetical protein